jgi:glycerophosphoryl diester phosphodiesterase
LIAPFILALPADKASLWLDGHTLDAQPGNTTSLRVAQAAASLGADIVSPLHGAPGESGDAAYVLFTDEQMTHEAHRLGVHVLPWTVNAVHTADRMHDVGAEGIITDFPDEMHAWAVEKGVRVPPLRSERRVEKCLREALARDRP